MARCASAYVTSCAPELNTACVVCTFGNMRVREWTVARQAQCARRSPYNERLQIWAKICGLTLLKAAYL